MDTSVDKLILAEKDPGKRMQLIIRHYGERLYAVIRPIVKTHADADDVMQETLLKIHRNWDRFRGDSRLFTWFYRIARNESLQFLRRKYDFENIDNPDLHASLIESLKADPWFNGDDIILRLEEAIESLPERRKEVFRLKYFGGLKYDEIAELTGLSVGALKAHYHWAVKEIKRRLGIDLPE